jgi:hypothetical protein
MNNKRQFPDTENYIDSLFSSLDKDYDALRAHNSINLNMIDLNQAVDYGVGPQEKYNITLEEPIKELITKHMTNIDEKIKNIHELIYDLKKGFIELETKIPKKRVRKN